MAFLADRGQAGVFQLHLLDVDGGFGEAVAAPEVPGTVEYLYWSPDGRFVLLGVAGLGAELSGGQGSGRNAGAGAGSPAEEVPPAWLPETDDGETAGNAWRSIWIYGVDQGELRRVSPTGLNCWEAGWCGTGGIVAITSDAPGEDDWYQAVLSHLDVATGTARTLLTSDVQLALPTGSPDGRDGSSTELFATLEACGGSTFYPDGTFTADGHVLTVQESYELPPQLVRFGPDGDQVLVSIAHPGTEYLRSVAGHAEAISWTAPDGLEIEGILCRPAGEGPFPLVVHVHGGPIFAHRDQWAMRSSWVPLLVSRGYLVLSPNPRGSSGRGQDFAARVVGDMGGALIGGSYGGFMSAWLVTQDARFAAAVPLSPVTDWYSQSFTSNIAAWGNRFLAADPEQPGSRAHTRSPVLYASQARTPCLNVAGALDNCTPAGQAVEFHRALRAHGVPSALAVYPQEGHGVRSYPAVIDFLTRTMDWFERYMPPNP